MSKRSAQEANLDVQVTVEGLLGIPAPQRCSIPSTSSVDDIKECVVNRVLQLTGERIFRSSFRLLQGDVHRPFGTAVSDTTSAKFRFQWSQPGPW